MLEILIVGALGLFMFAATALLLGAFDANERDGIRLMFRTARQTMNDPAQALHMTTNNRRLVIIGLDGATFDLIQPWIAAGELPNLQRLMAEGRYRGPLKSVVHPFTAQAWT